MTTSNISHLTSHVSNKTVVVIGLGYVGLPLALAFGRVMPTIGFELSAEKVKVYQQGSDPTGEMADELFVRAKQLSYTTDAVTPRMQVKLHRATLW